MLGNIDITVPTKHNNYDSSIILAEENIQTYSNMLLIIYTNDNLLISFSDFVKI